jgi:hypothetical protein
MPGEEQEIMAQGHGQSSFGQHLADQLANGASPGL